MGLQLLGCGHRRRSVLWGLGRRSGRRRTDIDIFPVHPATPVLELAPIAVFGGAAHRDGLAGLEGPEDPAALRCRLVADRKPARRDGPPIAGAGRSRAVWWQAGGTQARSAALARAFP